MSGRDVLPAHKPNLLIVAGPTASGKSALAVELALALGGEVVSADSRQVYRGLDVGSGKITPEETRGVPHHLIDILEPERFFSLGEFLPMAYAAIDGILERGRVPILCGGTGLYVSGIREGYALSDVKPDLEYREQLERLSTEALAARLRETAPEHVIDEKNRNRVMRALEKLRGGDPGHGQNAPRYNSLALGALYPREALWARIERRLYDRAQHGLIDEVRHLLDKGVSPDFLLRLGLEYRFITECLLSNGDPQAMLARLNVAIRQFSKRQSTWFRRDQGMHWLDMTAAPLNDALALWQNFNNPA